jgi:hypothetical protein
MGMKTYIGVKIVQAEPEARDGVQGYKVVYEEGWESWCPADVFERHNRETSAMPFGMALEAARQGRKITRKGWNGRGQYVYYQEGSVIDPKDGRNDVLKAMEGPIVIRPHLDLKTADGSIQIGWLASQSDMLGDDWELAE